MLSLFIELRYVYLVFLYISRKKGLP